MFQTDRLTIKKFTWENFNGYAALVADPEVMRFSLKGPVFGDEAKKMFEERILKIYDERGWGLWALFLDHELIGFAGLIPQVIDKVSEIELAFRIFPAYWGKGLVYEACQPIIDYAFKTLKLPRLISIIDPQNFRSQKLSARLGFHVEKKANYNGFITDIYVLTSSQ